MAIKSGVNQERPSCAVTHHNWPAALDSCWSTQFCVNNFGTVWAPPVFRYEAGGTTPNPVHGEVQSARLVTDPLMVELAAPYKELGPYLDLTIGGIAEEYVDPASYRAVVSIDGYIWRGKPVHFCVSDNTNVEGGEGALDSIVTPTQRLSKREVEACWAKFDAVLAGFVRRGADDQFVNVEGFVLTASGGDRVEVKIIEINFRPVGFFMPVLPKLHRGADMFSAAIDMLLGKEPLLTSPPGSVQFTKPAISRTFG